MTEPCQALKQGLYTALLYNQEGGQASQVTQVYLQQCIHSYKRKNTVFLRPNRHSVLN